MTRLSARPAPPAARRLGARLPLRTLTAVAALAGASLTGCADAAPTAPGAESGPVRRLASLALDVSTAAAPSVTALVVEVSGGDIPTPLAFTLSVADGRASGTVRVPPGTARTFTVRAYDARGAVTHQGTRTADVTPGANPALNIALAPVSGQVPLTITLAGVRVVLSRATLSVRPGDVDTVTAAVQDAEGNPVAGASVEWASTDPGKVTVANGIVTARGVGEARVVAVYDGVASAVAVTVGTGPWKAVTVAANTSCALTREGKAYCWGNNNAGQLGIGANNPGVSATPLPVAGNLTFTQLAAGENTVCGVATDARAYCWGLGASGQLGVGALGNSNAPREVTGGLQWRMVVPGNEATCGVTTAGRAYCWGDNAFGKLGDGTQSARVVPTAVSGSRVWQSISVGSEHVCAVELDGRAWCWGMDTSGQLGIDSPPPTSSTPRWVPTPTLVASGDVRFRRISAGSLSTCAIGAADGRTYCWGDNSLNQLGTPGSGNVRRPQPQASTTPTAALHVTHQVPCTVTVAGELLCWGKTSLVVAYADPAATGDRPTPVPMNPAWKAADVGTAYFGHLCVLTTAGQIACAGNNGYGQLGDGTQTNSRALVLVRDPQ